MVPVLDDHSPSLFTTQGLTIRFRLAEGPTWAEGNLVQSWDGQISIFVLPKLSLAGGWS